MPCNIAKSVQKLSISNEALKRLLAEQDDKVAALLESYFTQRLGLKGQVIRWGKPFAFEVEAFYGDIGISVKQGNVIVGGRGSGYKANPTEAEAKVAAEVDVMLRALADGLFGNSVAATLQKLGRPMTAERRAATDENNQPVIATVLTITL